ncbi:MAG: DNRLRE domain-containing protein, partial [Clostridia bacterium]
MAMVITQLSILNVSANDDTTSDWLHSVTLRPIDATYTSQHGEDANTNFHDSPNMMVNYTNRIGGTDAWGQYGYMKFDIGNIDRESVISAKLRLYVENAGDKTSSTRTIGIYETWESDWDGSSMTWATGRSEARKQLDSFTVTASGGNIIDAGWRELDVTDCVRNGIDPYVSLMAKMTSEVGYRVAITSGTYTGLPEDFDENTYNNIISWEEL